MGIAIKIKGVDFLDKSVKKITFDTVKYVDYITAVFDQGDHIIYETTPLDYLKSYLTVTAYYEDDTSEIVENYTLSGTLTEGMSTITVTYKEKTTTFTVRVAHLPVLEYISAVYTQGQEIVYTNTPLDDLKEDLVVTAHYDDGSTSTVIGADYVLSGTLTVGTSTVTVTYGEATTTFNVNVSEITLLSISAVYTQGQTKIYTTSLLSSLKNNLVVTANYDNDTSETIPAADYTLSGMLETGTSTITVGYEDKTTTFDVIVIYEPLPTLPAGYQLVEYIENPTGENDTGYIDLGVVVTPKNDKVVCTFEPTGFDAYGANKFGVPFGDYWGSFAKGLYGFITSAGVYTMRVGKNVTVGTLNANTKYTVSVYRDTIILNGTSIGTPEGTYAPKTTNNQRLFTSSNSSGSAYVNAAMFKGRIYNHKIYTSNVLKHNYYPCYRIADDQIGVYDVVTDNFIAATGTLTKGADITPAGLPTGYTEMKYIESTGTQYIDTGLKLNQDSKIEIELSDATGIKVLGARASATSKNFSVFKPFSNQIAFDFYSYSVSRLIHELEDPKEHFNMTVSKDGLIVNESEYSLSVSDSFTTSTNCYLLNASGSFPAAYTSVAAKLYNCKMYSSNTLVRNLIPCVNSSNQIGLYDTVNDVFYTNAGTGSFITKG